MKLEASELEVIDSELEMEGNSREAGSIEHILTVLG